MKTLADLTVGDRAAVKAVETNDSIGMRLMEMGLTPGVDCTLIGVAPLGDPLEFDVRGYRLSLRRSEAVRVSVEIES